MKLQLHNICAIKDASIKIDGLTIIAGENNAGKSTVGKMLFTLVKILNDYKIRIFSYIEESLTEIEWECRRYISEKVKYHNERYSYYKRIDEILRQMEEKHSKLLKADAKECSHKISIVEECFQEVTLIVLQIILLELLDWETSSEVSKEENTIVKQFLDYVFSSGHYDLSLLEMKECDAGVIPCYIRERSELIDSQCIATISSNEKAVSLIALCNEFYDHFVANPGSANSYSEIVNQWLYDEFGTDVGKIVTRSKSKEDIGQVSLTDSFQNEFSFDIKREGVLVHSVINSFIYKDSTLIESPVFLYLNDYAFDSLANQPVHIGDLISKVQKPLKERKILKNSKSCEISEILQGDFGYDAKAERFWYRKGDEQYTMGNVANGTKSFGILQMLNANGWIAPDNILVIDEPEVHLHPKWQVEYCRIVTALAKKGVRLVVTTHSPYIVQALRKLSEDLDITKDVNFYLSEEDGDGVRIQDKTRKLGDIYEKLTAPLREIM